MPENEKPQKSNSAGLGRIFSATKYSLDGLAVLNKEPALKHEVVFAVLVLTSLIIIGAPITNLVIMLVLLLLLIAVEALNTAIEQIVDEISPEISEFGKKTKDLGSCAVFLLICANLIYLCYSIFSTFS